MVGAPQSRACHMELCGCEVSPDESYLHANVLPTLPESFGHQE